MARTWGPIDTTRRLRGAWRHGQEDDFAKRLKDMGYEACGLGSKWPTKLDGSSQFYPKCPNWFWIIIYESWSWFQVWLELSYKANRKITIRYASLVGQCLSWGWHQEAVAAASGRAAGGPFDARDDMHPRIITKSEPFHLWGLDYLEGRRRKTLHPSPSHFCWLNHSFSHLLGIIEFQGTGSTSCCEISMQKQQMPRNCKGWGLVTPLDV